MFEIIKIYLSTVCVVITVVECSLNRTCCFNFADSLFDTIYFYNKYIVLLNIQAITEKIKRKETHFKVELKVESLIREFVKDNCVLVIVVFFFVKERKGESKKIGL